MNEMFDAELLRWWEEAGGDFEDDDPHRVSLAVMDEAKLLPFLRSFAARTGRRMTLPDETYPASPEATLSAMEIAPHAKPAFIKRCSAALDAFAARARAEAVADPRGFSEGIEAAAHWHGDQAARHRKLAARIQELLADPGLADSNRRGYLRFAQEHDTQAWLHEHDAKCIRGLAAGNGQEG